VITDAIAKDSDPRIRAHAAELGTGTKELGPTLLNGTEDKEPRVREAALRGLAGLTLGPDVEKALAATLGTEQWTFVKRATIAVLADQADDPDVDLAMVSAMENEEQPIVRSDILTALGARGGKTQRAAILDRAGDPGEALPVRVAAVRALGALCDSASLGDLTTLAQKGVSPGTEVDAQLAMAAINSLGHIHPKDLKDRLAPVLQDGVIADVRSSAQAAIAEEHTCSAR
jgi:HEAT repeat protein